MESRKTVLMSLPAGQQRSRGHRDQAVDTGWGRRRAWGERREQHRSVHTACAAWKTEGNVPCDAGSSSLAPCDDLEGAVEKEVGEA